MIGYNGQLKDVEYNIDIKFKHRGYKKQSEDILTLDIETTSAWLTPEGDVITYIPGKSSEYWSSLTPLSLCYIWQFSFNDKVYYGREWYEFKKVLDDLPDDVHFIIWVHNLSYEWHFLCNLLTWKEVFARNSHKPMKAVSNEYPLIEFRCSYMLTRLSLDAWGKQIGLEKFSGDKFNYELMRTPLTSLSDYEMQYSKRDCQVVYQGIKKYKEQYDSLWLIPLTQTGTVRAVVKDILVSDPEYVSDIKTLVPHDSNEYKLLQDVFAGGYTHANRVHAGAVIEGDIEHYDFASSYPTVMCCEKYPMSPWVYVGYEMPDISTFEDKAYIFELTFFQIESTNFNTYLQSAKCDCKGPVFDNGRIISANVLHTVMTEQDYITVKNNYKWSKLQVNAVYESDKDYLPKPFIEYVLELYGNKTSLKGVEGSEDLYMQSKQYVNSLFGMMVTAIVQSDCILTDDLQWVLTPLTAEKVDTKLKRLRSQNKREKRYFLSYSWGCWVTAYARRNLWSIIEKTGVNGFDVYYCDTDSIFCKAGQDYRWYDDLVTSKLRQACLDLNIDFEKTRPKTPKGTPKPLGIFDKEDDVSEFITLGAKRYCERRKTDNSLHLTISGINKGAVAMLEDDIYNFKNGFNFDKDGKGVKKQLCTYCYDMPVIQYPDGYVSHYKYGINLRRNGYKMEITDEYQKLLDLFDGDISDDEMIENRLTANFI